jgi:mRNA interferase MazF
MGASEVASVVIVPFPFSDLSASKYRPAVVLANAGMGDRILCMVTSNSYADENAIAITAGDFADGLLDRPSFVRPSKLFTASNRLIERRVARLKHETFERIRQAIAILFRG